jgi:hypothetical protein
VEPVGPEPQAVVAEWRFDQEYVVGAPIAPRTVQHDDVVRAWAEGRLGMELEADESIPTEVLRRFSREQRRLAGR